jgi:hypothetical protein
VARKILSITIAGAGIRYVEQDCVDVVMTLNDGQRFAATFTTLPYLRNLFTKNATTVECCAGAYLWIAHLIIVRQLSRHSIQQSLSDLLVKGEHERCMEHLP